MRRQLSPLKRRSYDAATKAYVSTRSMERSDVTLASPGEEEEGEDEGGSDNDGQGNQQDPEWGYCGS